MADAAGQFLKLKGLIETAGLPAIGPECRAGTTSAAELEGKLNAFFTAEAIPRDVQSLLRCAALLWHDHLEASHAISQKIETRDGSWLHGIMHRREADYGNAKYWFRRVGRHEAFPKLCEQVTALAQAQPELTGVIANGEWDPSAFVDRCAEAELGNDAALRRIQGIEFDVLLQHILSHA